MNPEINTLLMKQANHERYAATCYTAMAYWCEDQEYMGFAEFFHTQAKEEIEHSEKFFAHLVDRCVMPVIEATPAPHCDYKKLLELAEMALKLETANSKGIHECYAASVALKDFASMPLLLEFISEQVEEEAWANKMINLLSRSDCAGALYSLDRHIVKEMA